MIHYHHHNDTYTGDNITTILAIERDMMADLAKHFLSNHGLKAANAYFNRVSVLNSDIKRRMQGEDKLWIANMQADLIINNNYN